MRVAFGTDEVTAVTDAVVVLDAFLGTDGDPDEASAIGRLEGA